jgi:hypothetical protein
VWDDSGDKKNTCRVLVGIPERKNAEFWWGYLKEKRLLGSRRH